VGIAVRRPPIPGYGRHDRVQPNSRATLTPERKSGTKNFLKRVFPEQNRRSVLREERFYSLAGFRLPNWRPAAKDGGRRSGGVERRGEGRGRARHGPPLAASVRSPANWNRICRLRGFRGGQSTPLSAAPKPGNSGMPRRLPHPWSGSTRGTTDAPRNFGHFSGSARTFAETIAWHRLQTHGESHGGRPRFMSTSTVRARYSQPHWRRPSRRKPMGARGGRGAARGRLYYNRVQKRALPNKDLRRVTTQ